MSETTDATTNHLMTREEVAETLDLIQRMRKRQIRQRFLNICLFLGLMANFFALGYVVKQVQQTDEIKQMVQQVAVVCAHTDFTHLPTEEQSLCREITGR